LLPSLVAQTYPSYEILVMDNGSSDGGPEYVEAEFPQVRVFRNGRNLGFVGANHRGFGEARGHLVVLLNPDTEVEPRWLEELIDGLGTDPSVGLATSQIRLFDERDRLNTCGNDIHVTGFGFCRGLGEPPSRYALPERAAAVSGAAFVIRREVLDRIGGFDEDFFLYLEDTDLSFRANLAGYEIRYVPGSIVYHKYRLKLRPQKFFFLERNRIVMLAKNLDAGTLLALSPALLLAEAMTWAHAVLGGREYVAAKLRAYRWLLSNVRGIARRRARVQRLRRVGDRELLDLLSDRVPLDQLMGTGRGVNLLNMLVDGYFWGARRLALGLLRSGSTDRQRRV
jgi:GT2 family glycosyltransferase